MNRWQLAGLVPLLALTCGLNALTRGAYGFRGTFSARAGRSLPRAARIIDGGFRLLGQTDHCAAQVKREDAHGGNVWRAWAAEWNRPRGCPVCNDRPAQHYDELCDSCDLFK